MRRPLLSVWCVLALSCLFESAPAAQQTFDQAYDGAQSPRNASYDISVRLDPSAGVLRGIEIIRWRNISNRFTRELYVHAPRRATITRLEVRQPGGRVVRLDGTPPLVRTTLPWEVAPLETIELFVEWHATVPRTGRHAMVRWFPQMAVLEDRGWTTRPTRADYGSYDVQLTTPRDVRVEATGFEAYRQENPDGSITYRYRAEDVREFTWEARRTPDGVRPMWYVVAGELVALAAVALSSARPR